MFSKIKVKPMTVDEWKNKLIVKPDPNQPARLGVSMQSLTEANAALFLLPITIDTIADDETRPNRNIALQALIHFASVKATSLADPVEKGELLVAILGRIASMVGSRGNRSLEAQTKKLLTGAGYYARSYVDKGVTWKMSELLTTCNDFYAMVNHVAVNRANPPNWLGALAIVTRPSTFMYHVLSDFHGTIPEALPPKHPFKDNTQILFEVIAGSSKVLTKGIKTTKVMVGAGGSVQITQYTVTDTWSVNVGIVSVTFNTEDDMTLGQTVTPNNTVVMKAIAQGGSANWPYSDEFMAAGAVPDDSTFKWYFMHWWERNLEQRQKTLAVTDIVRQAALSASFTTHSMAWHMQTLVPAILSKVKQSPFAVNPHTWKQVASDLKQLGNDFALALLSSTAKPTATTAPDFGAVRTLVMTVLRAGNATQDDVHDYGMYRKAIRSSKAIPPKSVPGWDKPEETLLTKPGAQKLNSLINHYIKPDTTDGKIVFGIVRVMATAGLIATGLATQPVDDSYLTTKAEGECDDVYISKEELHKAVLSQLWGVAPAGAAAPTDAGLDALLKRGSGGAIPKSKTIVTAQIVSTTVSTGTLSIDKIYAKWVGKDNRVMYWQDGIKLMSDDEIDLLKAGYTTMPASQIRLLPHTDSTAQQIRAGITAYFKKP